ncbi:hypothetical protein [Lysobacter sp. A289]
MAGACICGCEDPRGASVHPVATALMDGDVDCALQLGLLKAMPCPGCSVDCHTRLVAARADRIRALAARERFRARDARLERRRAERTAQRSAPERPAEADVAATAGAAGVDPSQPALPVAVAAALARAKAKAAGNPGTGGAGR